MSEYASSTLDSQRCVRLENQSEGGCSSLVEALLLDWAEFEGFLSLILHIVESTKPQDCLTKRADEFQPTVKASFSQYMPLRKIRSHFQSTVSSIGGSSGDHKRKVS